MCGPNEDELNNRGLAAVQRHSVLVQKLRWEQDRDDAKKKHLSDIEFLNQHAKGK